MKIRNSNLVTIPDDYSERVYAGVLGKIIGVYLGRPFEQWSHERIVEKFGEIRNYVNDRVGLPLIVSDDDITGTFAFFRGLTDRNSQSDLTPRQIGQTWLNYIIENKTILWWGGIGLSTEHTAWCRLASGIPAPESGSAARNGTTVSEQIGSQIFIDAWGLANPGDPESAADFACRAASVSHDGLAIHGAQVIAAMIAAAFVHSSVDGIISSALAQIPADSLIRKMADDIAGWHSEHPADWLRTFEKIRENYGYDRYGGGCHIVPNHALIHLALRHSGGDFHKAQMIVNTAGWDTDCNAGNVGCILGVAGGLEGLSGGPDWRRPVADRLLLPTADGGGAITDALRESYSIINAGRRLRKLDAIHPKGGARFHFSLPGSVQGFLSSDPAALVLHNKTGALSCEIRSPAASLCAFTSTFTPAENFAAGNYSMCACPTLHPGQIVCARFFSPSSNAKKTTVQLAIKIFDENFQLTPIIGPSIELEPGDSGELRWTIPGVDGYPIAQIGFQVVSEACGTIVLDSMDWNKAPTTSLMPSKAGTVWSQAWVRTMEGCMAYDNNTTITLHHSREGGFLFQGSRDWGDYSFRSSVEIRLAETFAILIRAQGLRRHYSLRLDPSGRARIVKACDGESVLAEAHCPWVTHRTRIFEFSAVGGHLRACVDGVPLLEARDNDLNGGAAGFLLERGGMIVQSADICALQ